MIKLNLFIRSFLLGGLLIIGHLTPAFSQSECVFSLQRAERLYQQGNIGKQLNLLQDSKSSTAFFTLSDFLITE